MNVFTVSLFGHRTIDDLRRIDERLIPILREVIREAPYVEFMIGRHGAFDEYAASLIKLLWREIGKENSEITLVLPYTVKNLQYYERYYDHIIIPECVCGAHPKSAIGLKNRWMVENSELVIVFVERNHGGAYAAMKYAEQKKKRVINLNDDFSADFFDFV